MKKLNYYVINGNFSDDSEKIVYHGKEIEYIDQTTQEKKIFPETGMILFPGNFREGTITFNVVMDNTDERSRVGIIFDYKNIDGKENYYQIGIRNDWCAYSLDYWDGKTWDHKMLGGSPNTIKEAQKYNIKIEKHGNIIRFFVNDVMLYTYTNMINISGLAGIFLVNTHDTTITGVDVQKSDPKVFAIMKFEKDFDELYNEVIVPMFKEYGYKSIRADECYTSTSIINDIVKEISDATVIIADITMDNPNVFYELGYAHALGKPTILLADIDKRDKLPFDVSGFRTIFYSNSIGGKREVEKTLSKYIQNIN